MAYISYNKLWESELDGIVSKREKIQDLNIIQLKLEVHDTYKKDEKKNKLRTYRKRGCYKQMFSR